MLNKIFSDFVDLLQSIVEPGDRERFLPWLFFWIGVIACVIVFYIFGGVIWRQIFTLDVLWKTVAIIAPFIIPILLLNVLFEYYMEYIRADYIKKEGSVLLEIKIPKETNRSPLAMEIFFTSLYHTGSVHMIEAFWQGKIRSWFSLELVSVDGQVHFFIWCWKRWRNLIEAQLYAQYPNIEIHEVDDYAKSVYHDPDNLPFWGTYFKLEQKDVYPIKTYVDYGLDKPDLKEEFKIDPMTSVLEYLGSLKKGEQAWIQILMQAHRKEKLIDAEFFNLRTVFNLFKLKDDWKGEIDEEIEKIRERSTPVHKTKEGEEIPGFPHPTPGEVETMKALDRSRGKIPFEVAIRGFYIAKKEAFNPINVTGMVGSFRQYNSNNLNGFKLGWYTDPDEPWRDYKRKRRNHMEREMLKAYKLRSFFWPPYKFFHAKPMILTTEELATIYHFPGGVAQTPTLERIMSKKSEPPTNLPR